MEMEQRFAGFGSGCWVDFTEFAERGGGKLDTFRDLLCSGSLPFFGGGAKNDDGCGGREGGSRIPAGE